MTKWTKEWPTEPDRYWFWGQPYWSARGYPPQLCSVKVYDDGDGNLYYLADGSYIHRGEAEGVWCPAVVPAPPITEEDPNA